MGPHGDWAPVEDCQTRPFGRSSVFSVDSQRQNKAGPFKPAVEWVP